MQQEEEEVKEMQLEEEERRRVQLEEVKKEVEEARMVDGVSRDEGVVDTTGVEVEEVGVAR